MRIKSLLCAVTTSCVLAAPSQAAVFGSLVFMDPTGTVAPTDVIEVWATLTIDQASDPFIYNSADAFPNGVNEDDLPEFGFDDDFNEVAFDEYSYIYQFHGRTCSDTFTVGCSSPGSAYSYSSAAPHPSSPLSFDGTINPGDSVNFFMYNLTPTGAGAPEGDYQLDTVSMGLGVTGLDEFGGELDETIYQFSTNCSGANCTFTRSVVSAVPVPAAAWLFGSALLGLGALKRRKV